MTSQESEAGHDDQSQKGQEPGAEVDACQDDAVDRDGQPVLDLAGDQGGSRHGGALRGVQGQILGLVLDQGGVGVGEIAHLAHPLEVDRDAGHQEAAEAEQDQQDKGKDLDGVRGRGGGGCELCLVA